MTVPEVNLYPVVYTTTVQTETITVSLPRHSTTTSDQQAYDRVDYPTFQIEETSTTQRTTETEDSETTTWQRASTTSSTSSESTSETSTHMDTQTTSPLGVVEGIPSDTTADPTAEAGSLPAPSSERSGGLDSTSLAHILALAAIGSIFLLCLLIFLCVKFNIFRAGRMGAFFKKDPRAGSKSTTMECIQKDDPSPSPNAAVSSFLQPKSPVIHKPVKDLQRPIGEQLSLHKADPDDRRSSTDDHAAKTPTSISSFAASLSRAAAARASFLSRKTSSKSFSTGKATYHSNPSSNRTSVLSRFKFYNQSTTPPPLPRTITNTYNGQSNESSDEVGHNEGYEPHVVEIKPLTIPRLAHLDRNEKDFDRSSLVTSSFISMQPEDNPSGYQARLNNWRRPSSSDSSDLKIRQGSPDGRDSPEYTGEFSTSKGIVLCKFDTEMEYGSRTPNISVESLTELTDMQWPKTPSLHFATPTQPEEPQIDENYPQFYQTEGGMFKMLSKCEVEKDMGATVLGDGPEYPINLDLAQDTELDLEFPFAKTSSILQSSQSSQPSSLLSRPSSSQQSMKTGRSSFSSTRNPNAKVQPTLTNGRENFGASNNRMEDGEYAHSVKGDCMRENREIVLGDMGEFYHADADKRGSFRSETYTEFMDTLDQELGIHGERTMIEADLNREDKEDQDGVIQQEDDDEQDNEVDSGSKSDNEEDKERRNSQKKSTIKRAQSITAKIDKELIKLELEAKMDELRSSISSPISKSVVKGAEVSTSVGYLSPRTARSVVSARASVGEWPESCSTPSIPQDSPNENNRGFDDIIDLDPMINEAQNPDPTYHPEIRRTSKVLNFNLNTPLPSKYVPSSSVSETSSAGNRESGALGRWAGK